MNTPNSLPTLQEKIDSGAVELVTILPTVDGTPNGRLAGSTLGRFYKKFGKDNLEIDDAEAGPLNGILGYIGVYATRVAIDAAEKADKQASIILHP